MRTKQLAAGIIAAVLAVGLLAGCGSKAENSSSSEAASSSSEAAPETKSEASAGELLPDNSDENSIHKITDPASAFASSVGWGPGTAGTSLKAVIAAADMMSWAEENELAKYSGAAETVLADWYGDLTDAQQANFAEAWPLIKADAASLLTNKSGMLGLISDAGLSADALPGCTLKNWNALKDILDDIVPEVELQ